MIYLRDFGIFLGGFPVEDKTVYLVTVEEAGTI